MAMGFLGTNNGSYTSTAVPYDSGTNTVVVYTCPAGVTGAVLHVFYSLTANASNPASNGTTRMNVTVTGGTSGKVAGVAVATGAATVSDYKEGSASVMLGPGESVSINSVWNLGASGPASSSWTATVTGYEL
jgi:hypothetical protein